MAQLVLSNLDDAIFDQLKRRAETQGRSLEAEIALILEKAAKERIVDMNAVRARADAIRKSLEGRVHTDSVELIREGAIVMNDSGDPIFRARRNSFSTPAWP